MLQESVLMLSLVADRTRPPLTTSQDRLKHYYAQGKEEYKERTDQAEKQKK